MDHVRGSHGSAGTIDPQDHGTGFWVFEGSPQARNHIIGTGLLVVTDHAFDFNQCGMLFRGYASLLPAFGQKQK